MKIVHIVTGLDLGGAESVLRDLAISQVHRGMDVRVISLTSLGLIGGQLNSQGISVRALGLGSGSVSPIALIRLAAWLRNERADIIQTWMYHANLLGGLAARLVLRVPVLWGLHHVLGTATDELKPRTLQIARISARLSALIPDRIICCAESVMNSHIRNGYAARKMVVIPNGVDVNRFHPDSQAQATLRTELGVDRATPLVGMFARYHPAKDHATFIRAASILRDKVADVHFVLCGDRVDGANQKISAQLEAAGLARHFHLLGVRSDMPRLYAGLDLASLSSRSEAFPLMVCEAMACAVPCVTTDVGDCAHIIADTGRVVPVGDAEALAAAWLGILQLTPSAASALGARARKRICSEFTGEITARRYLELYHQLLSAGSK